MKAHTYSNFEDLPNSYDILFALGARLSFCLTRQWFEGLAANVLNSDERLCLIGIETDARESAAVALMAGRHRDRSWTTGGARALTSLSNYYSMVFQPLVAADADPAQVLGMLAKAIRDTRPKYDVLRFQPLDRASPLFGALQRGLCDAGLVVQPYFHLSNWYEMTVGMTSAAYLSRRPATLRNTIRRKTKALAEASANLQVVTGGAGVERGLADYESVYGRSWKEPEPYPQVIRSLARSCAAEGALRLGLLHLEGAPIAAQIWIVWNGKATLYKLAHDARFDHLSPGTVLTMGMMERFIDVDGVSEVNFGVGDDTYKRQWTSEQRELWGLVAFEPRTVRGVLGAIRHVGGRKLKRMAATCVYPRPRR